MINILLPWPPSANRIWRKGRGRIYRNPAYKSWQKEAGWTIKASRFPPIKGYFWAEIILTPPPNWRGDQDNRVKPLLDIAQAMGLIENDRFCTRHIVSFGDPKTQDVGARLILHPTLIKTWVAESVRTQGVVLDEISSS